MTKGLMIKSVAAALWRCCVASSLFVGAVNCSSLSERQTPCDFKVKNREAFCVLPKNYNAQRKWPLILVLHGYGLDAKKIDLYLGISDQASRLGFVAILPNGEKNKNGKRFWNAGKACCNFDNSDVDDVEYLTTLLEKAKLEYVIDPKKIYVVGYSNGGFMAHYLACHSRTPISGFVSIAGLLDTAHPNCQRKSPVSVLQIHGTSDGLVSYDGSNLGAAGAEQSTEYWAKHSDCGQKLSAGRINMSSFKYGDETRKYAWPNCREGQSIELWKMEGVRHAPWFWRLDVMQKFLRFLDPARKS